jgi:hypothetical protein
VPTVAEIGLETGDAASFLPKNEHDWLSRAILQVTFTYDISRTLCDLMPALPCSPCVDRAAFLTLPFSSFPMACDEPEEPGVPKENVDCVRRGGRRSRRRSGRSTKQRRRSSRYRLPSHRLFCVLFASVLWCTVLWSICDTSFTCDLIPIQDIRCRE